MGLMLVVVVVVQGLLGRQPKVKPLVVRVALACNHL